MELDATTFDTIATHLLPRGARLTPDEATAIAQLAELATDVDFDEMSSELALRRQIQGHVCRLAGISPDRVPPPTPLPLDDEERRAWIARLAPQITTPGAGALAYVLVYLCTVGDLALEPVETSFVDELEEALGLDHERASDLVARVTEMITPDVGEELAAPPGDEPTLHQ